MINNIQELETQLLTPECIKFLRALSSNFSKELKQLLQDRKFALLPKEIESVLPDYKCDPLPQEILQNKRTVEITGPASDAKLFINALNSGANVFMADLEDSMAPTWANVLNAQMNLKNAINKTLSFQTPDKKYTLNNQTAILMVRPRGLHMIEKNFFNMPASLFDFGVFLFHNYRRILFNDYKPYFYLPKLQESNEAAWWEYVFAFSEQYFNLKPNIIKCTVLIETLPAVLQMDAIIYALRSRILALNCGRWDYIFSIIKNLPTQLLPDRSELTMDKKFLDNYSRLIVQTCHNRGIEAIGGMSAYIPVKDNQEENQKALDKVKQDKIREIKNGCDGTWVAHPGLIPLVKDVWKERFTQNSFQVSYKSELLRFPNSQPTVNGALTNINICMEYLVSWLSGNGCVAINNLMEDMATAEISRVQLQQMILFNVVNFNFVKSGIDTKAKNLKSEGFDEEIVLKTKNLMLDLLENDVEFIVDLAYNLLDEDYWLA